ncbi:MAG: helix-turn-helix transcriptional regulator [Limnohabitans sp.]|nr:helix-turn-helix transcriptional regulator [Limnohabitans sp.]
MCLNIARISVLLLEVVRPKRYVFPAAEMGQLLGVSAQSVYHWETGKTKPRASQLAAIAAVRKMGKRDVAAELAE